MPDGISRSTVFLPPMTSVWPALWPPWKRTTPCALSVSQSTILPLPSSPHWAPMTTTFFPLGSETTLAVNDSLPRISKVVSDPSARQQVSEPPQVEREAGCRTRSAERLADAVVAAAPPERRGLARGEDLEDDAVVVMIATQVGEIDGERNVPSCGSREGVERRRRVRDRGDGGQLRARGVEHCARGAVERRQRGERIAPRLRQRVRDRAHRGQVLGA